MMISLISEVSGFTSLSLTRPWVNMSGLNRKRGEIAGNRDAGSLTSLTALTKMMKG